MFYIFQLGTDMLTFTCLYFIELLFLFIGIGVGVDIAQTEKIFLYSFPILLLLSTAIMHIIKKKKQKSIVENKIFHPTQTFRQRFATFLSLSINIVSIIAFLIILFFSEADRVLFIIIHSISLCSIILSFVFSLYFEVLPDKNDTIRFEDNKIYYYMRVKKDQKNNKYMNSYIIPFDAIIRSYIIKNTLYIEFNRNHPELQIHREFSTKSKRIAIPFNTYPEIKCFVKKEPNSTNIKLKSIKNIELADFY